MRVGEEKQICIVRQGENPRCSTAPRPFDLPPLHHDPARRRWSGQSASLWIPVGSNSSQPLTGLLPGLRRTTSWRKVPVPSPFPVCTPGGWVGCLHLPPHARERLHPIRPLFCTVRTVLSPGRGASTNAAKTPRRRGAGSFTRRRPPATRRGPAPARCRCSSFCSGRTRRS